MFFSYKLLIMKLWQGLTHLTPKGGYSAFYNSKDMMVCEGDGNSEISKFLNGIYMKEKQKE